MTSITRLSIWQIPLTSHEAYHMADGKSCETVTTTLLRIDTDTGLSGWGEVCPIPHYLPAYADGVIPAIQDMVPVLIDADPIGPEALMAQLDAQLQGHHYAKSIIDMALWDLTGKAADLPLYALLGGLQTRDLPLYQSITCVAPDEMVRMAKEAYAQGIRQFQVKLGADKSWETDLERLVKVREAVGAGPLVYGDWNCGGNRLDCTRVGRAVAHLDIMLEQPCPTLEQCAAVRAATGLPIKIDENGFDFESLLKAQALGCLDAYALKTSKSGGISASRRLRDLCLYLGTRLCVEDTWGSDITTSAALHLASATPSRALLNTCDLSGYVSPHVDPRGPVRHAGSIQAPDGPGLGIEPNLDLLVQPLAVFD